MQSTSPSHRDLVSAEAGDELIGSKSGGKHSATTVGNHARPQTANTTSEIESLVDRFLSAERDLASAVDAAGGRVPLPDGRTISTGRAEFDALPGQQRRRAWVVIRKNALMPPPRR